jgi:hypothetical protein
VQKECPLPKTQAKSNFSSNAYLLGEVRGCARNMEAERSNMQGICKKVIANTKGMCRDHARNMQGAGYARNMQGM